MKKPTKKGGLTLIPTSITVEPMPHKPRPRVEYTQEQLEAAFDEVKNARHWKNPISRYIKKPDDAKRDLLTSAVIHFTGSVPEFYPHPTKSGYVRISAAGYYATIGA